MLLFDPVVVREASWKVWCLSTTGPRRARGSNPVRDSIAFVRFYNFRVSRATLSINLFTRVARRGYPSNRATSRSDLESFSPSRQRFFRPARSFLPALLHVQCLERLRNFFFFGETVVVRRATEGHSNNDNNRGRGEARSRGSG